MPRRDRARGVLPADGVWLPTRARLSDPGPKDDMSEPPPSESPGEQLLAAACACRIRDAGTDETGPPMDPKVRGHLVKRLHRIEQQIKAIQAMVMDDDYCGNIMTQIVSAHVALRGSGRELVRNHLRYCTAVTLLAGPEEAREMLDEVVEMVHKLGR
jgi:DNA-binding FrmR family transcriptional regulator